MRSFLLGFLIALILAGCLYFSFPDFFKDEIRLIETRIDTVEVVKWSVKRVYIEGDAKIDTVFILVDQDTIPDITASIDTTIVDSVTEASVQQSIIYSYYRKKFLINTIFNIPERETQITEQSYVEVVPFMRMKIGGGFFYGKDGFSGMLGVGVNIKERFSLLPAVSTREEIGVLWDLKFD